MNPICPKCGEWNPGKCKDPQCPVMAQFRMQKRMMSSAKQDFFGKSPNVFVGRHGYPDINVGFLSVEEYAEHDNPLLWSRENFSIDRIIGLRTSLVNSSFKSHIKSFDERLVEMGREVGMAEKPVDMEINLSKKPNFSVSLGSEVMPHGPNIKLKNARITENPKIPKAVDAAVSDSGLKAGDALEELYRKDVDEHYLTRLLSIGNLGVKSQRKLVPTRWSITAVDDAIGKRIISEVKSYPAHDYAVFFGGHLGNYYIAIFFPETWGYELFESYAGSRMTMPQKEKSYMTDYEGYDGRKEYAFDTAGGYYAARLAVLEHLKSRRRQASVLLLRFITDEYYAPLGVWVVREAVRKAMASKPIFFGSKELALQYARGIARKRFGMNADVFLSRSRLLKNLSTQRKLSSF